MVPSPSPHPKAVYTPKGLVPHAALLGQACAHCRKSLAAATRRCGGRVSVPLWPAILSDRRPIVATVGRHPAVQLIGRGPLPGHPAEAGLSSPAPPASEAMRYQPRFPAVVPHPGAGRPRAPHPSAASRRRSADPPDLHALGTPPALILSQDQTLHQTPPPARAATRPRAGRRASKTPRADRAARRATTPRAPPPNGPGSRRARPTLHLLNVPPTVSYPPRSSDRGRLHGFTWKLMSG